MATKKELNGALAEARLDELDAQLETLALGLATVLEKLEKLENQEKN